MDLIIYCNAHGIYHLSLQDEYGTYFGSARKIVGACDWLVLNYSMEFPTDERMRSLQLFMADSLIRASKNLAMAQFRDWS